LSSSLGEEEGIFYPEKKEKEEAFIIREFLWIMKVDFRNYLFIME
jgi:hypothetical protein